jgi:hypothetical protein
MFDLWKATTSKDIRSESYCLCLTMANQIEIIYEEKHICISYGQPNLVTKCWGGRHFDIKSLANTRKEHKYVQYQCPKCELVNGSLMIWMI